MHTVILISEYCAPQGQFRLVWECTWYWWGIQCGVVWYIYSDNIL